VGRKRRWPIGCRTTRDKLECLLYDAGVKQSDDLWSQQGYYRGTHFDLAVWGCNGIMFRGEEGHLYCWDTMTACVRYGIEIVKPDHAMHGEWEVHARAPCIG